MPRKHGEAGTGYSYVSNWGLEIYLTYLLKGQRWPCWNPAWQAAETCVLGAGEGKGKRKSSTPTPQSWVECLYRCCCCCCSCERRSSFKFCPFWFYKFFLYIRLGFLVSWQLSHDSAYKWNLTIMMSTWKFFFKSCNNLRLLFLTGWINISKRSDHIQGWLEIDRTEETILETIRFWSLIHFFLKSKRS